MVLREGYEFYDSYPSFLFHNRDFQRSVNWTRTQTIEGNEKDYGRTKKLFLCLL